MNKLISNEGEDHRLIRGAPLLSGKMDAKTLNAAMDAGT